MKTFLKIFAVLILLVLITMITIPLVFKKEIMQKVKEEVNKNVKAQVDWTDFSVSLFKGFPDLKITLDELSVVGIEKFEGDTLIAFDRFMINIDLMSVFSGKIKVKSFFLDQPVVRAIALADGSVNWDITYPSEEPEIEETDTSAMEMTISLKKFEILNGRISYNDEELNMGAWLDDFNLTLTGDFSEKWTELDLQSLTRSFTVDYEGIKYINKAVLDMKALIGADLVKYEFTFNDNEIRLNDLILGMEGMFGMPNDEDITVDIRFFAKETSFKSLLSMVPAIYASDFEGLKSSGTLSLDGTAKGLINEKELPKVDIKLLVDNGHFSYPDLPKSVDNMNVDMAVFYDGVFEDNTTVDINKFHLEIGGNPIDMYFKVRTPMSDMQLTGAVKGTFDLASFADVVPVEDMNLNGIITTNIELMGKMSDIETENYEAFKADGLLEIKNIEVSGGDVPFPVKIEKTILNFSPKYVNLDAFDAYIGTSDIHMNGKLENFIPYVFADETVKGQLELTSHMLNLNELMSGMEEDTAVEETETELSVIEVPGNIFFVFDSKIDQVLYDKLDITDINGKITAKDGKLVMDNLAMNLLKGNMIMSGEYNTVDINNPMVDFNFDMNNIDIPSAFYAFNTVEKLAPVAEDCRGNVSLDLIFNSFLDSTMYPVMTSITGKGKLQTDEIEILENNAFTKMSQLLKNDKLKNPKFKDVNLSFEIRNGRVYVDPFDTKVGSAIMNIGGDQGIDQTMNYFINMSVPRSEFGASANDLLEDLASKAAAKGFDVKAGENVNMQVKITGTFTDPKFSLDAKESMKQAREDVKEAVQQRVEKEITEVKEEVKEKAGEEIDRIMKQAEEDAEKIRQAAKEAGEKLIGEARLQGNNLIKEAGSNPIKKLAAQKAAEELEKNAKKQADKLAAEADQKATKLLEEAQAKADALKNK